MAAVTNDTKPFKIAFGSKSKPKPVAAKKRAFASLDQDDSEEDQDAPSSKVQVVHGFDHAAGGALSSAKQEEKVPLVIAAQKNLNWRDEAKRRRGGASLLPAEEQARRAGKTDDDEVVKEKQPVYGLVVTQKGDKNGDVQMTEHEPEAERKPKTLDEEALEALLGEKESALVLEGIEQENARFQTRTNDADTFKADIASRPESASLADYEAVPIEDFGLALLRGQGYKPGDPIGRRKTATPVVARVPQKRADLLGIGATEVPTDLQEPGAWGKGAKKSNKIDRNYKPVVLKNRETGEILTEAELKAREEQQNLVVEEASTEKSWRRNYDEDRGESSRHSSSRRYRSRSRDKKDRRRNYDDDRYDSSRHSSSKRDRSRSRDRKDPRDRARERDYEKSSRDKHGRDRDDRDDRKRRDTRR